MEIRMYLHNALESYLAHKLSLNDGKAHELARVLVSLGIRKEIFKYSKYLRTALLTAISNKQLSESFKQILQNAFFVDGCKNDINGITEEFSIFSFHFLTQNLPAYKFYSHELSEMLTALENNKEVHSVNKLYQYSLACRSFIIFISDNYNEEILRASTLKDMLKKITDNQQKDKIRQDIDKIKTLVYESFKNTNEKFLVDEYFQIMADGQDELHILERLGYFRESSLITEDEELSQAIFSKEKPKQPAYKKYMSSKYRSLALQRANTVSLCNANSITLNEIDFFYSLYKSDKYKHLKLATIVLIFSTQTGIDYSEIVAMLSKSGYRIFLTCEYGYYSYDIAANLAIPKGCKGITHTARDKVFINLHPRLHNMMLQLDKLISEITRKEIEIQFTNQLKMIRTLHNKSSSLRLTEKRISNFFKVYYTQKYLLNDLIAQYISAELISSKPAQQFYTLLTHEEIHEAYNEAFDKCCYDIQFPEKSTPAISEIAQISVGSKIVPEKKYLIKYFKDLKTTYASVFTPEDQFNLRSFYLYSLLMLISGLRPLAAPVFNNSNLDINTKFAILRDKRSKYNIEFRNQPLCDFITNEFKQFNGINQKYFNSLDCIIHGLDELGSYESLLFLINENNNAVTFSKQNVLKHVHAHVKSDISNLPQNFLRHNFRTFLSNKRYNSRFINFCMGHNKTGQEMFNTFSSIDIIKYRRQTIELQNRILKEYQIESLY